VRRLLLVLGVLFCVLLPLTAVWLASSLAAHAGAPRGWTLAAALLMVPGLPLLWEVRVSRRRARPSRLNPLARLGLRTLAVSTVFLGMMVGLFPNRAFVALAMRGDWMLEGDNGKAAEHGRTALHSAARGLEWLYLSTRDDPYQRFHAEAELPAGKPVAVVPSPPSVTTVGRAPQVPQICAELAGGKKVCVDAPPRSPSPEAETRPGTTPAAPTLLAPEWPLPDTLHRSASFILPSSETSIEAVADQIKLTSVPGPDRVKAIHDWVADRISYDVESYFAHTIPDQSAEAVFKTRLAVCAGYALLVARLGELTGEQIVVVGGDAKGYGGVSGHAWNAANMNGGWALLDVTWDSGAIDGEKKFARHYSTRYLFAPPAFFLQTHLPLKPQWQLVDPPMDRGEFLRRPAVTADFFKAGLKLLEPQRSQVDTFGHLDIRVENPLGISLGVDVCRDQACEPCSSGTGALSCALTQRGPQQVMLRIVEVATGRRTHGAAFDVNNF